MSRRNSGLFRGTELPRMLFLASIVLAGWPMVVLFARPRIDDKPPPPPVRADSLQPIVPDGEIEFQALIDKVPIQSRESAAYANLLERTRETPDAELIKSVHQDVLFTHLFERPKKYRGVPIHLIGTAKRILSYEVNPGLAPKGRLFEAWVYSDENRAFPYVLIFEEPPTGLPIGPDLALQVSFDGYFLKLLGYRAQDKDRAAPMLVGRLRWIPPTVIAPAPMFDLQKFSRREAFLLVFVLLLAYIAIRGFFQVRKALRPARPARSSMISSQGVAAEELAEWLQNLPEDSTDPVQKPRTNQFPAD